MPKRSHGFTLVELLVVITILSILGIIASIIFSNVQKNARDGKRRADLKALASAMEVYYLKNNTYSMATNFPCSSGGWLDFNDGVQGVYGTWGGSCPSSIKNALTASFAGGVVPEDPLCSGGNTCSQSWSDYALSVAAGGASYVIYARLEDAPSNPCAGAPSPYNHCVANRK